MLGGNRQSLQLSPFGRTYGPKHITIGLNNEQEWQNKRTPVSDFRSGAYKRFLLSWIKHRCEAKVIANGLSMLDLG